MEPLGPGRIFWAVPPGTRGEGKKRPMVAVTRVADIRRTGQVLAVVCSTDFELPLRPKEVLLPSEPDGKSVSRLRRPTVAVCDWTVFFPAEDVNETGGFIPGALLREICRLAGITLLSER